MFHNTIYIYIYTYIAKSNIRKSSQCKDNCDREPCLSVQCE